MDPNIPPVSAPTPIQPVHSRSPIGFIFCIVLLATTSIMLGIQNWQLRQQLSAPTTYEECARAPGSIIQTSYPGVCVSKSGKQFTQPLTDEERKKLVPPTEAPSPSETPIMCGGVAGIKCPTGFVCQMTAMYPDAGGTCVSEKEIEPKICTEELKLCPDGSSVARTGPNCEFSPCPR